MPVGAPVDLSTPRGHADAHTRPLTAHKGCRIAPDKRKGRSTRRERPQAVRNMSNLGSLEPKAGSWHGTDLKTSARQSLSPHVCQQPAGKLSALRLAFEHRAVLPLGRWQLRKPKGPADIPRHPGDRRQSRHSALCPAHRLPAVDSPCGHGARGASLSRIRGTPQRFRWRARSPPQGGPARWHCAPSHSPAAQSRPEPTPALSLSRRTASLQYSWHP